MEKEIENKKKSKKVLKKVAFVAGATMMLGGGIIASGAVKSYEAQNQNPKDNHSSMQNVDSINADTTNNIISTRLANTDIVTQSTSKVYSITSFSNLLYICNYVGSKRFTPTTTPNYTTFSSSFVQKYQDWIAEHTGAWYNGKICKSLYYITQGQVLSDVVDYPFDFDFANLKTAQKEEIGLNKDMENGIMIYLAEGEDDALALALFDDADSNDTYGYLYLENSNELITAFKVYREQNNFRMSTFDSLANFEFTGTLGNITDDDYASGYPAWASDTTSKGCPNIAKEILTTLLSGLDSQNQAFLKYTLSRAVDVDYPSIESGDIVVNVDNPLTIEQIKSCFSANDPTEGDLTKQIKFSDITYVLDSNGKIAVGQYSITASVSDSSGNSSSVTKKIHVVDITAPIVAGTNFSTGNVTKLTDADIIKHLTYSDNYYSKDDITISLEYSDYIANYKKPGKYDINVAAKDKSGNIGTTVLTVTVTDTTKPSITGTNKTTGNSTCLSQDELKSLFSASDDVTAAPTITIVNDGYTANYRKPGTYTVTAKATDAAGNTSDTSVTITVTDTTAPTIAAISATKNQSYTTKLTEAELKALFKVTDDVTTSPTVTIISDNYTAKYNTPGTYTVTAKATDAAGNSAQASVTIKVIDDIKPIIVLTKQVKTTTQLPLTLADIAKYVSSTDAIDGTITPSITDKDGYLTKTNKVGTYNFEVTATDRSGNVAKDTFVIIVEDKDVPVITVSGYTITASAGQVYKRSDIINFLIQTGQLTEEEAESVSVESTYFDSENPEAGTYSLQLMRADGSIQEMSLVVTKSLNDNEDKKNNVFTWMKDHLAITISAIVAVVLAALGFVFLRKKRK